MIDTCQYPRKLLNSGYVKIKVDGLWIAEHRWIIQQFLGRELNKEETIHHINGIRADNHIDNLMLFKDSKEHSHFHRQIKQFGLTKVREREIKNNIIQVKLRSLK